MAKSPLFSPLVDAKAPVERALILLCEKCGKKIEKSDDFDKNPARLLQKALKSEFGERGEKGLYRAVVTSCMNVCPDGTLAVAIAPTGGGAASYFEAKVDDLGEAREAILQRVRES